MTQRTDKELLELAAKAAGMVSEDENKKLVPLRPDQWNPLINNAEAFVLSVNMGLHVQQYKCSVEINKFDDGCVVEVSSEDVGNCRLSATRRAIVRAAAEIGAKL